MSEDASIAGLKATINLELDHLERLEHHAAEVSQILDQMTPLQQMTFAASAADEAGEMTGALGTIKEGLEVVFAGIASFRQQATQYLGRL